MQLVAYHLFMVHSNTSFWFDFPSNISHLRREFIAIDKSRWGSIYLYLYHEVDAWRNEILSLSFETVLRQHKTKTNNNKFRCSFCIGQPDLMNMTLNVTPNECATHRTSHTQPTRLQTQACKVEPSQIACASKIDKFRNAYPRVQIVFYICEIWAGKWHLIADNVHIYCFTRFHSRDCNRGVTHDSFYFQQMQITKTMRRDQNRRVYHVLCPNGRSHSKINWKHIATGDVGLQLITCHCVSFNWVSPFAHNLIAINSPVILSRSPFTDLSPPMCIRLASKKNRMQRFNPIAFAQREFQFMNSISSEASFWSNSSWNLDFVIKRNSHWRAME